MFGNKVVVVSLASFVLLFVCATLCAANDPWVLKVLVTDTDGMYSSGTCRIGFRDTSIGAVGPGPCPPGGSMAIGIDWIDELTASIVDYRPTDSEYPQTWNFSLYYTDNGAGAIDPLQVVIAPSATMPYPYSTAGNLGIEWYDGESWQSAVYDGDNQLTAEGLSFTIAGTPDFSYSSPNLIITAGSGEEARAPQQPMNRPQPSTGGSETMMLDTPTEGTIAWAKTFADDDELTAALTDKVVSRAFPGLGYFYIQEPDRSSGIRVSDATYALSVIPGDVLSITSATLGTDDGERVLNLPSIETGTPTDAPKSAGINNRDLGGADWSYDSETGAGQKGPAGGHGLNNVGLLVEVWGKVTSVSASCFYVDDGSNVTDGGTAAGVRVLKPDGYQPYTPAVGDCIAVTGISGLATYDAGSARTVRLAQCDDLNVLKYVGPPTEVEVQATGLDSNDYGKLTIYWKAAPGATGYNVYRGTTSGGEDYQNPVNGSSPWNTPTYTGSSKYAFTDTGLTAQEYFYAVKAVRSDGESEPSFEDSEIPDPYGMPWDSDDAYTITSAANYMYGGSTPSLTRVVGPDGTIYCSQLGVLRPGGSVDLGTLQPGTNFLQYSGGARFPIPDDGNELGNDQSMQSMDVLTGEQNQSDGPYRRVRSKDTYTGSYGVFAPGWLNGIYMSPGAPDDTYWTYLGSRSTVDTGNGLTQMDVDAGLQWSRVYSMYNPYLSLKLKRPDGDLLARILAPSLQPIRFDTSYFPYISMCYALQAYPFAKGSVPMLKISGRDQSWYEQTVLLAAANPIKSYTGMMKRAHSIAQGGIKRCRSTGSYFEYASFSSGMLRDGDWNWVTWTADKTADEGRYPDSPPAPTSTVQWNIPSGREYYEENSISIHANYTDTRRP